jgi:hypothetical protein
MDVAIRKLSETNRTLMIYMFNTAYCIMKEELPYTLYTTMLKLQVKIVVYVDRLLLCCLFLFNLVVGPEVPTLHKPYLTDNSSV